jgi:hypothetical protein
VLGYEVRRRDSTKQEEDVGEDGFIVWCAIKIMVVLGGKIAGPRPFQQLTSMSVKSSACGFETGVISTSVPLASRHCAEERRHHS